MRHVIVATLLFACEACGGGKPSTSTATAITPAQSCKDQFSPDAGYGWQDDLSTPTSAPDGGATPPGPSALDRVIAACVAADRRSSECDANVVMTHRRCALRGKGARTASRNPAM